MVTASEESGPVKAVEFREMLLSFPYTGSREGFEEGALIRMMRGYADSNEHWVSVT